MHARFGFGPAVGRAGKLDRLDDRGRRFRSKSSMFAGCALALAGLALFTCPQSNAQENRGEYLVGIMDCGGCHTPGYLMGKPDMTRYLGGSDAGFEIPGLGIFYPPNLTNDETGLAAWSEDQIVAAIRIGVRPDGRELAPIMPYHSFAALTDEDAYAIAKYLKSTKPLRNKVPDPVGLNEKPPLPYMTMKMPE